MQFDISEDAVKAIVEKNLTQAVERAVQSYSVESTIKEQIANGLTDGHVAKAVYDACDSLDKGALGAAVAHAVGESIIRATTLIVAESLANTVLAMRGVQSYDKEFKEKRHAIVRELLGLPSEVSAPVETGDEGDVF